MLVFIWIVVVITALVLYFRQAYSKFRRHDVKELDTIALVTMMRVILRKEHFLDELLRIYKQFPNEKFAGRYEFTTPMIVARDLELIKRITIKDFEYFLDHRGIPNSDAEPLFTRNLLFLRGQEWKDMRSTLSPAFTSSKIRLMIPFMDELGNQMISTMKEKFKESNNEYMDIDCKDLTTRYANDVIASCAFGLKVNSHKDRTNKFYEMGVAATNFKLRHMLMFMLMAIWPAIFKVLKFSILPEDMKSFFVNLILGSMKDREEKNIIRPDMIHLLMQVKKGSLKHEDSSDANDTGFAAVEESMVGKKHIEREWSDIDIVAQAIIFFFAGFETISTAMSFALHELAANPETQERLVQEIKQHAEQGGKLDFNSIQNMKYLDMVVSEVLRKWPPMPMLDRMCVKDSYNLGRPNSETTKDYIIRKGEVVLIPIWSIHHDPEYFPEPEKFDPERFSEENKRLINPMAYLPFGSGPRNCVGSRFALLEVKILLYKLLMSFEVSPSAKTVLPGRMCKKTFGVRLEGGHWLRFRCRN